MKVLASVVTADCWWGADPVEESRKFREQKRLYKTRKPSIICAFPGCGKSWATKNGISALDSDSSKFSWMPNVSGRVRNPDFPANYIEHIKNARGYDYHFVSTHKDVRDALTKESMPYVLVYPDSDLKEDYLARYKERGSPEAFIKVLTDNH